MLLPPCQRRFDTPICLHDDAIVTGAKVVWMQLGMINEAVACRAPVQMNRRPVFYLPEYHRKWRTVVVPESWTTS